MLSVLSSKGHHWYVAGLLSALSTPAQAACLADHHRWVGVSLTSALVLHTADFNVPRGGWPCCERDPSVRGPAEGCGRADAEVAHRAAAQGAGRWPNCATPGLTGSPPRIDTFASFADADADRSYLSLLDLANLNQPAPDAAGVLLTSMRLRVSRWRLHVTIWPYNGWPDSPSLIPSM
jgi:hypothetical protein